MRLPDLNIRRIFDSFRGPSSVDPEPEPPKKKRKSGPVKTFIIDSMVVVLLLGALFYIGSGRPGKKPVGSTADPVSAPSAKPATPAPVKTAPKTKPAPPVKSAAPAPVKTAPKTKPTPRVIPVVPAPVKAAPKTKPTPRVIPVVPAPVKAAPKTKPAPTAEPIKPIVSRPVAKNIPRKSRKSSKRKKVYRIRFAVCQIEESCRKVQDRLSKKGVKAALEKTVHNLMTHHVALGPWRTRSHAQKAKGDLLKLGIKSSLLVSGDRYFMITKPEFSLARVRKTLSATTRAGFKGKIFSRKETQDMYKVYGQSLGNPEQARLIRNQYKKKGIDCIVED